MANHKSAEKRARQAAKRNAINKTNRSRLRTMIKSLRSAVKSGDAETAKSLLPQTVSLLDKSSQKGVLHRNAAARNKSRLTDKVNQMGR